MSEFASNLPNADCQDTTTLRTLLHSAYLEQNHRPKPCTVPALPAIDADLPAMAHVVVQAVEAV